MQRSFYKYHQIRKDENLSELIETEQVRAVILENILTNK